VDLKEELQQISVAQLLGVEQDLESFGVRAVVALATLPPV
jgi:hypothetical protein